MAYMILLLFVDSNMGSKVKANLYVKKNGETVGV